MTTRLVILLAALVTTTATARADDVAPIESAALPASVDLRPWLTERGLGPRRQGRRNTCSVMVMAGAMEAATSRALGRGARLSPEYLNWATNQVIGNREVDRGQFFHDLWRGYEAHGVCEEAAMPYRTDRFHPDYAPDDAARASVAELRAQAPLRLVWLRAPGGEAGLTEAQLRACMAALAAGHVVCAGSGHSLLYVGYEQGDAHAGGGRFVLHDSGSGRVGHMTFEEARRRICDACYLEVIRD